MRPKSLIVVLIFFFSVMMPLLAQEPSASELKSLSLDQLLNVQVSTVSRRLEPVATAPAAVHVITGEDVRRSGVTSVAEALRMAPGVQVARLNSHSWAISSRGFNALFSNKQLVLIDGRSVYSPVQSGVYWDVQNVLLEDLDRIEVIRGPGGTLWGANAVNGVINIITKSSRDTQGLLISGGGGTEEREFGAIRYGDKLGEDVFFRVYGKYENHDDFHLPGRGRAHDDWWHAQGGLRLDWHAGDQNLLTFQGDLYSGEREARIGFPSLTPPFVDSRRFDKVVGGGNVLGRWTHTFSETSDLQVQAYLDRVERDQFFDAEDVDTYDLDVQHRFQLGERQEFVWGGGYRLMEDHFRSTFYFDVDPIRRHTQLVSAFIQDEIELIEEKLSLTIGSKFEHNDYTGFEVQPSARIGWQPAQNHFLWGAISRAVRTPSRLENDLDLNVQALPGPVLVRASGSSRFDAEELLAYEVGYRLRPFRPLSFDLSLFYNEYEGIRSTDMGTPFFEPAPAPPHLVIPFVFANKLDAESYGAELTARWEATSWWRLEASYSFLQLQLHRTRGSTDTASEASGEGNTPHHQLSARSAMNLGRQFELDLWLRYADSLPNLNIPSYLVSDVRLAWVPHRHWEVAIVFQNLLDSHHPEFQTPLFTVPVVEVEHSVFAKVTYRMK